MPKKETKESQGIFCMSSKADKARNLSVVIMC